MTVEWRPIPGWEGSYEVSDDGRVRSLDRKVRARYGSLRTSPGQVLSTRTVHGYPTVVLYRGSKRYHLLVHRLVGEAFLGPQPKGIVTRHLDGNPLNNSLKNLRYGTSQENADDAKAHRRARQSASRTGLGWPTGEGLAA